MSIFQGTILDIRPYATDFGAIVVGDDPHTLVVVRITCMREACGITFEAGSVVEFAISELAGPFEMFLDKDISFILFGKRGHTDQFYGLMPIGC
jgi:hypothetical protein